jgi:hypothetical protein
MDSDFFWILHVLHITRQVLSQLTHCQGFAEEILDPGDLQKSKLRE